MKEEDDLALQILFKDDDDVKEISDAFSKKGQKFSSINNESF